MLLKKSGKLCLVQSSGEFLCHDDDYLVALYEEAEVQFQASKNHLKSSARASLGGDRHPVSGFMSAKQYEKSFTIHLPSYISVESVCSKNSHS